jgi:oxalate---CoA ligase
MHCKLSLLFMFEDYSSFRRRVGFAQATKSTTLSIPADIEQLRDSFDVLEAERMAPDWDFMWNALIEEGREKKLKQMPLSRCPEPLFCSTSGENDNDNVLVAEAALKVLLFPSYEVH